MNRSVQGVGSLLVAATLACNSLSPRNTPTPLPPTPTPRPPTLAPTPSPAPPTHTPAPTAAPDADLAIEPGGVFVHPEPVVYSGDIVSFEVFARSGGHEFNNLNAALYLGPDATGAELKIEPVRPYGLGDRLQATFVWVWDTAGLHGQQTLTVVLDPQDNIQLGDENPANNSLTFTVDILPPVAQATEWLTLQTACCTFNYITGSPAERDLDEIQAAAEAALGVVEARMGRQPTENMTFNLIDRLLGHGGFAADTVTITYIDRDYAGGGLEHVFRHEAAHVVNRQFGAFRPALIEEGTATYVAGGHFKEEPFQPRVVGLLALGRYIPLSELADDFYNAQHEIGYLEGAAFAEYLITAYGWEKYARLLGAFRPAPTDSGAIDAGLRLVYEKSFAALEAEWLAALGLEPLEARWRDDIDYTVQYFDTLRRYQQVYDPSAHFLTAWIPDIRQAVREDIVADYARHPERPENIALEAMLIEVDRAIEQADFAAAQAYLAAVNAVLDAGGDFATSPLAATYLHIAHATVQAGYEPHRIQVDWRNSANTAAVTASRPELSAELTELTLTQVDGLWHMN